MEKNDDLRSLSPDELRERAHFHLHGFFSELRNAQETARERYSPLQLLTRHPVGVAGGAASAGILLAMLFRHRGKGKAEGKGHSSIVGSLLKEATAGLAGKLAHFVPSLVMQHLHNRRARCASAGPEYD